MSYYAKYKITVECPKEDSAVKLAKEFREEIAATDFVDISGKIVFMSCYNSLDNQYFAYLSERYPGTFITANYYGDDEEIGVIYARDGKSYSDFAQITFPPFDRKNLLGHESRQRCDADKRIKLASYSCKDDLGQYVDSMLFDSGTEIAEAKYQVGENTLRVSLEVRGEVAVDFKGITYHAPSEFPDELKERIRSNPGWWDVCAPSGEDNSEPDSDVYIKMNNWFEGIWEYRGYTDGVMFEDDISKSSEADVKEFFDEIAKSVVGEHDADILKSETLRKAEGLGWTVREYVDGIEFSQYSPAGEDFSIYVSTGRLSEISEAVKDYYDGFDPEEHTLTVFKMKGAPGLRECLDDAEKIDEMLKELSHFLNQAVEDWCALYGVDDRSV